MRLTGVAPWPDADRGCCMCALGAGTEAWVSCDAIPWDVLLLGFLAGGRLSIDIDSGSTMTLAEPHEAGSMEAAAAMLAVLLRT